MVHNTGPFLNDSSCIRRSVGEIESALNKDDDWIAAHDGVTGPSHVDRNGRCPARRPTKTIVAVLM